MKYGLLVFFQFIGLVAWSCSTHHVTSQGEVDQLASCTIMTGDLTIQTNSSTHDPIVHLNALLNLVEVQGSVIIRDNPHLIDIVGLSQLLTIGGRLEITNNSSLNECCSLFNLLNLGSVTGGIVMTGNASSGRCNFDGTDVTSCTVIPTVGTWSTIILSLILLIFGVLFLISNQFAPDPMTRS